MKAARLPAWAPRVDISAFAAPDIAAFLSRVACAYDLASSVCLFEHGDHELHVLSKEDLMTGMQ